MKPTTINGMIIPQFEPKDFGECMPCPNDNQDYSAQEANDKLQDYYKNRVCLNCKHGDKKNRGNVWCDILQTPIDRAWTDVDPESFSCSAFEEKK